MSNSTAFIIQARKGSTRLPNKVVMPFYENKSVLDIIITKLKTNFTIPIILATTVNEEDDELVAIAEKYNIQSFRGSSENVLDRFIQCANQYQIKTIVRICADNPFLDIDFLNKIINTHTKSKADYTSYCKADKTPVIKTHYGVFAEVVEVNALKKVASLTQDNLYIEHVTNYIYAHETIFKLNLISIPTYLEKMTLRLTLDSIEDWAILQKLYKNCYDANPNFSTKNVIDTLDQATLQDMQKQIERYTK